MGGKRVVEEINPRPLNDSVPDEERRLRLKVGSDLSELGLVGQEGHRATEALMAHLRVADGDRYEALLAGVRVATVVREVSGAEAGETQSSLREVEKLMGGFAAELRKFDEVLEVLSTYVRRMRSCTRDDEVDSVLH